MLCFKLVFALTVIYTLWLFVSCSTVVVENVTVGGFWDESYCKANFMIRKCTEPVEA